MLGVVGAVLGVDAHEEDTSMLVVVDMISFSWEFVKRLVTRCVLLLNVLVVVSSGLFEGVRIEFVGVIFNKE